VHNIQFPVTECKAEEVVAGFHRAHGIPQCLGAVDGTHGEAKHPFYGLLEQNVDVLLLKDY